MNNQLSKSNSLVSELLNFRSFTWSFLSLKIIKHIIESLDHINCIQACINALIVAMKNTQDKFIIQKNVYEFLQFMAISCEATDTSLKVLLKMSAMRIWITWYCIEKNTYICYIWLHISLMYSSIHYFNNFLKK